MSDLKTLLDEAVADEHFTGPGPDFYPAAERAVRRRGWTRAAASAAGVAVLAGGGVTGAHLLGGSPAEQPPLYAVAAASAPACVRTELAVANDVAQRGIYSAVVVDIPGKPTDLLTHGISSGYGWKEAWVERVLQDLPGLTPDGTFALWEGVTPAHNPAPGTYLMFLFLDNRPGVPSEKVGDPVWSFTVDPVIPLDGDDLLVTCADGTTTARVSLSDTATWLGPQAPTATRPAAPGAGGSRTASTAKP